MNIPSPAGTLEARLDAASAPADTCAVLCHPHPLYGGNKDDGVLDCLAQALLAAGVDCLRFNFRGVGASTGAHEGGTGEVDDLLAAVDWVRRERVPRQIWLGGYSFGACMAWNSLSRGSGAGRVLLIAPPVGHMPFTALRPDCPVDVFTGDADPFVNMAALAELEGVSTHVVSGADHFFSGRWDRLQALIEQVLDRGTA